MRPDGGMVREGRLHGGSRRALRVRREDLLEDLLLLLIINVKMI